MTSMTDYKIKEPAKLGLDTEGNRPINNLAILAVCLCSDLVC